MRQDKTGSANLENAFHLGYFNSNSQCFQGQWWNYTLLTSFCSLSIINMHSSLIIYNNAKFGIFCPSARRGPIYRALFPIYRALFPIYRALFPIYCTLFLIYRALLRRDRHGQQTDNTCRGYRLRR
jgi:hypothetical protein